jgi:hypothetical protein
MTETPLKDKCFQCDEKIESIHFEDELRAPGYDEPLHVQPPLPPQKDPWELQEQDHDYLRTVRKCLVKHLERGNTVTLPFHKSFATMRRVFNRVAKEMTTTSHIWVYLMYDDYGGPNGEAWEKWTPRTTLLDHFTTATKAKIQRDYD